MILTLFLCIKLSILHLCVSDLGYECKRYKKRNDHTIFLVQNEFRPSYPMEFIIEGDLNLRFQFQCEDYYNFITGSLEESKNYTNVIQFAVPDYYDGKLLENFVYAGNVNKKDDAVCTKTIQVESEFHCRETVNLVSQSLKEIDHEHIYNLVQALPLHDYSDDYIEHRQKCEPPFQKPSDLTVVLLCIRGDRYIEVNIKPPLKLIQVTYSICPHYLNKIYWLHMAWNINRLLAVLAPEPFDLPSEYSVPTIFYEAAYMSSESKSAFPNSMNLAPWRLLKYGFLKFIQTVGWQRVAIVTDDSEYSIDFEEELTALFSKEQLVYTVIRCEDANCEMQKIAEELDRVSARIVIANVEKKHAYSLFRHAPDKITWLLRDMAEEETARHLRHNQNAFSLSLYNTESKGCPFVEGNIITGLSGIAKAYRNLTDQDYNVKKREFYRLFAEKVKDSTERITEAKIIVSRIDDTGRFLSMSVKENGETKIFNSHYPYDKSDKPLDGTEHCLVTSWDFHKPCGDPVLMLLSFTLLLFVLTILLITCYFEKTSPVNDAPFMRSLLQQAPQPVLDASVNISNLNS